MVIGNPADPALLPVLIALGVFVIVLATLALLMPLFVYHIRNDMRRTAESLDALNINIMRALDGASPASTSGPVTGASTPSTPLELFPNETSIEKKPLF